MLEALQQKIYKKTDKQSGKIVCDDLQDHSYSAKTETDFSELKDHITFFNTILEGKQMLEQV